MKIQQFRLWKKLEQKRAPLSFDLEITARCNMNCTHCYINLAEGDTKAKENELTAAEILAIAREAAGMGAIWCLITGGEPLLREDFFEIYMGLKRLGMLVAVFTNAALMNEAHVALFKKYPPRDIEITVYGVTQETYERVTRSPGSFEKFRNGLGILAAAGVRIRLKTMAVRSNLNEQRAIADFCRTYTKDYFRFDPQLHLRFDGDPMKNAEIRAERLTPEKIVALEAEDEQRLNALRKECDREIQGELICDGSDLLFQCGAGNGNFTVGYDGRFRLCPSLCADGTTYDLKTGTLTEAWKDFAPRVREMRSRRQEFINTCRQCPLGNLCFWCPAHAHLENGQMDGGVEYFCRVAHARAAALKRG